MTRWAVTGAGGFVGSALVAALRAAGDEVVTVHAPRLTADPAGTPADLAAVAAAHPAVDRLAEALAGADVVVNAAGVATPDAPASPELTGANALLPAVLAVACAHAGAGRFLHVSSAAVQGRRRVLDESPETDPFSPYSAAKAAGEAALARVDPRPSSVVTVRPTSVHGPGRPATARLARFASSRLASVAGRGTRPSVVCHVADVAALLRFAGLAEAPPPIVLQPWSGTTTAGVLRSVSGGREPRHVPTPLAYAAVGLGHAAAALARPVAPGLAGVVRRVEVLWLGQRQVPGWAAGAGFTAPAPEVRP